MIHNATDIQANYLPPPSHLAEVFFSMFWLEWQQGNLYRLKAISTPIFRATHSWISKRNWDTYIIMGFSCTQLLFGPSLRRAIGIVASEERGQPRVPDSVLYVGMIKTETWKIPNLHVTSKWTPKKFYLCLDNVGWATASMLQMVRSFPKQFGRKISTFRHWHWRKHGNWHLGILSLPCFLSMPNIHLKKWALIKFEAIACETSTQYPGGLDFFKKEWLETILQQAHIGLWQPNKHPTNVHEGLSSSNWKLFQMFTIAKTLFALKNNRWQFASDFKKICFRNFYQKRLELECFKNES